MRYLVLIIFTCLFLIASGESVFHNGIKVTTFSGSKALQTSASKVLEESSVTTTELGYLSGVSSAIQDQLNAKAATTLTTNGDILYYNSGLQRLAAGTEDYVLTMSAGGLPNWEASASGFADPMTTRGDIIYKDSSNVTNRLAVGTAGQVLGTDGTDVAWSNQQVVSPNTNKIRICTGEILLGGSASVVKSDGNCIESASNGTGTSTLAFASGVFSSYPICQCTALRAAGAQPRMCMISGTTTTTALVINIFDDAGTAQSNSAYVTCIGEQ